MKFYRRIAVTLMLSFLLTSCSSLIEGEASETKLDGMTTTQVVATESMKETTPLSLTSETSSPQTKPTTKAIETTTVSTMPVATKSKAEELVEGWKDKIYPGVTVSGLQVGGLSFQEADKKVREHVEKVLARKIPFTVGSTSFKPSQKELGLSINFEKALDQAMTAYEKAGLEEKAEAIITRPKLNFKVNMTVNDEELAGYIKSISSKIDRKPSYERTGRILLKKTMQEKLSEKIRFTSKNAESFKATLKIEPKLIKAVATEPESKPTTSHEENTQQTSKQVVIGSRTTKFNEKSKERSYNIKLATSRIHKVVLKPGEVFSTLKWIKAPNQSNGYKLAPVYSGGTMVDGPGGGVCQVSSTLYNAVIRAGLDVVERSTHGFSVGYLPLGMDATLYAPSIDFKFRNSLDYPITIQGIAKGGKLTFKLLSDPNAMGGISYKFTQPKDAANRKVGKTSWTIIKTDELAPGKEEILVVPHPAASQKVYRKTYKNDKLIKSEFFDKVSYQELVGVKRVGR